MESARPRIDAARRLLDSPLEVATMNHKTGLELVCTKVLRQHEELRARLRGLDRMASGALCATGRAQLHVGLVRFASAFDAHLAFEEEQLVEAMRDLDPWSGVRDVALREEHTEQRARLERLCAMAEEEDSVTTSELSGEVHWLVDILLVDIVEEESRLTVLLQIEAQGYEQMTG